MFSDISGMCTSVFGISEELCKFCTRFENFKISTSASFGELITFRASPEEEREAEIQLELRIPVKQGDGSCGDKHSRARSLKKGQTLLFGRPHETSRMSRQLAMTYDVAHAFSSNGSRPEWNVWNQLETIGERTYVTLRSEKFKGVKSALVWSIFGKTQKLDFEGDVLGLEFFWNTTAFLSPGNHNIAIAPTISSGKAEVPSFCHPNGQRRYTVFLENTPRYRRRVEKAFNVPRLGLDETGITSISGCCNSCTDWTADRSPDDRGHKKPY
ncbi:unnamed protein product [Nesidiocoris tenuis]|uniref:Uncharacterized protein n=1 Tax=Nesidiocoris tenuis TaxID=355587 RepID=A0A6H5HGX1_9HEMI|nr:unnamed protein product [Nesidiocoris tenuis]